MLHFAALGAPTDLGDLGEALGIQVMLDLRIGACSAGMRQRVAIAAAFAKCHTIVVLDEPFNWLDPVAAFDLKQVLRAKVAGGLTLITALHDITTLASQCDAGLMMRDGEAALQLDRKTLAIATKDPAAFEGTMIRALRSGKD